jgi:hypothetical protein
MADKDFTLGIKTTGDTSGVKKVESAIDNIPDALEQIPDAAKKAERSIFKIGDAAQDSARDLDVLVAKQKQAAREAGDQPSFLNKDVSGAVGEAGEKLAESLGFGKEFKTVAALISADSLAVAGSFAAIGTSAVAAYKLVSGTVDGYKELMAESKANGESLGQELEGQVLALESALAPLTSAIDFLGQAWESTIETINDPIGELSGLADLMASLARAREQMELLQAARLKLATENQSDLAGIYTKEVNALKEQEATLKRIAGLRNQMRSLESQAASQEIDAARLRGGDVELARANALAVELRNDLGKLGDALRAAQASAATAVRESDAAGIKYQAAIKDNLDKLNPAEFQKLSAAVDLTQQAITDTEGIVAAQKDLFVFAKTNILRGAETELGEMERERVVVSAQAEAARTAIFESIKTEVANIGTAGIAQIQVSAGTISTAASEKAGQIAAVINTERAATVSAVEGIATQSDALARASVQLVGQIQAGLATAGTNTAEILTILRQVALSEATNKREISELRRLIGQIER